MPPASAPAGVNSIVNPHWIGDDRFSPWLTALCWLLVILLIVPEGLDYSHLQQMPTTGSPLSRLLWLGLCAASAAFVLWRIGLSVLLLRWLNPFLLALLVLAAASVLWSIAPGISARRLIRLATILLCTGASVLVAWHPQRFQQLLRPILTLMLAGSLVFGLLCPQWAIHSEQSAELAGAWRGLCDHKNRLGALACTGLLLWLHAGLTQQRSWPIAIGGVAIATTCLLLSRSSTALVTALFSCGFLLLLRLPPNLRRALPWLSVLFSALLLAYSLAVLRLLPGSDSLLAPITTITGKDLSFTGRTEIWTIVIEQIQRHPWLGSGYGAYWSGPVNGTPSYEMVRLLYFYPGSAHNGYLDVCNDLGAIGLILLLGYLAGYVAQTLSLFGSDRDQALLYLAVFFQQAITNLSESQWFSVLSVSMVTVTLATVSLARALLERRLHAYFGSPDEPVVSEHGQTWATMAGASR